MSWFPLKSPRRRGRDESPTRQAPSQNIVASGFLEKKGARALSGWKSRYFVLCQGQNAGPGILKYYDSDGSTEPVRAEIPLPLEKGAGCIFGSRNGAHPVLELKLVQRMYRLRCSSKEQYDEWIQAIRTVIDPPRPRVLPQENGGQLDTPAAQKANIPSPPDNTPAEPRINSSKASAVDEHRHHTSGFVASELDSTALFATSNADPSNVEASVSATEAAAPQINLPPQHPIISPRPDLITGLPPTQAAANGKDVNPPPLVPPRLSLQQNQAARPPLRPPIVPSLDFQQLNPLGSVAMSPRNLTPRSSLQAEEQAQVGKTAATAAAAAASIKAGDKKDRTRSRSPGRMLGGPLPASNMFAGGNNRHAAGKQTPPPPPAKGWVSPRLENAAISPRGPSRAPPVPILSVDMRDASDQTPADAQQIWTTDGSVYFRSATKLSPRHYRTFRARKFLQPDLYTMDDDSEFGEEEEEEEGSPDSKHGMLRAQEGSRAPPLVEHVPSGVPEMISDDDLMDILIRKQERAAQQEQMRNEIRSGAVDHASFVTVPVDSVLGGPGQNQSAKSQPPIRPSPVNGQMYSPREPGLSLVPLARPSPRSHSPPKGYVDVTPRRERNGAEGGGLPPWGEDGENHSPGGWKVTPGREGEWGGTPKKELPRPPRGGGKRDERMPEPNHGGGAGRGASAQLMAAVRVSDDRVVL